MVVANKSLDQIFCKDPSSFGQLGFVDSFVHSVAKIFNNEQNKHGRTNYGAKINYLLNIRATKSNSLRFCLLCKKYTVE